MKKNLIKTIAVFLRVYLYLSIILFILYLIAPLFGGKFHLEAIILYGSWIGFAIIMISIVKKKQNAKNIEIKEFLISFIYYLFCMFIWFNFPVNIILCIFGGAGLLIEYRKQKAKV